MRIDRPAEPSITLAAMGDSLARRRNPADGSPFDALLESGILDGTDLRLMNLETVLTDRTKPVGARWISLRTDPGAAADVRALGIDAVNLAHNHILDYGAAAALEMRDHLADAGLASFGVGGTAAQADEPIVFERNGLRIGMIGCFASDISDRDGGLYVSNLGRLEPVRDRVRRLSEICDVPVVSLHWGPENIVHPSPDQVSFARSLVDCGAALVVGHHSHCVQGVERYKQGLIAYSLGNFNFWMFDARPKWFHRLSAVLEVELTRVGVSDYRLRPVWIDEDYCPVPLGDDSPAAVEALAHFERISADVREDRIDWNRWYEELSRPFVFNTLKGFAVSTLRYGPGSLLKALRWLARPHTRYAIRGLGRSMLPGRSRRVVAPSALTGKAGEAA